jgi:hypothetical protein
LFSAGTAAVLFPGGGATLPAIRTMGVIGYTLAAVVSLGGAAALPRPVARRLLVGCHLALLPLQ